MSRSINESINQLQTSLSDIKTSLSAKNVEGGEQLKVSEVAGLINQIEAGGGGGFNDTDPSVFTVKMNGDPVKFGERKSTGETRVTIEVETNLNNEIDICLVSNVDTVNGVSTETKKQKTVNKKTTFSSVKVGESMSHTPILIFYNTGGMNPCYGFLFFILGMAM